MNLRASEYTREGPFTRFFPRVLRPNFRDIGYI